MWPGLQIPLSWVNPQNECRVPRVRGPQLSLNGKSRQCLSVSVGATSAADPDGVISGDPGLHSCLDGGSIQAPDFQGEGRLKEAWKGTLEQQDGHNNKANT